MSKVFRTMGPGPVRQTLCNLLVAQGLKTLRMTPNGTRLQEFPMGSSN